jgi:hypothetical protein
MDRFAGKSGEINHRQLATLSAGAQYCFGAQGASHGVVRLTARTDLLDLAARCLPEQDKSGKSVVFRVPRDLAKRLGRPG